MVKKTSAPLPVRRSFTVLLRDYDFAADIHLFHSRGEHILLDVNSGAIHLLDDMTSDLVEYMADQGGSMTAAIEALIREKTYERSDLEQAADELKAAREEQALFTERVHFDPQLPHLRIKALCLNVAHACNMSCKYCFAQQGDFGMKPALMDADTGKRALEFLIRQSGLIRNLEVDFFGGEPLLVFDVVRELVLYARQREPEVSKRFNFTLTTNASLLTPEIMEFVVEHDISVILSLDGRQETNDAQRIFNNGQGTYQTIVPRIQAMVAKQPPSYYVRGTFTRSNLDFAQDVRHMAELGFDSISVEPAVGADSACSIKAEDLPQVMAEYERLTELLLDCYRQGKDIHFFHYNLNLDGGPCIAKRSSGCGAGLEYLAVTPEGDIYPCHQFVGVPGFLMGNVHGEFAAYPIRERFEHNQMGNKACSACWARYFCGGGCHANAYFTNKDMSIPDEVSCVMQKKRIEEAIYLELAKQQAIAAME